MDNTKRNYVIIIVVIAAAALLLWQNQKRLERIVMTGSAPVAAAPAEQDNTHAAPAVSMVTLASAEAKLYRQPTCGCCGNYVAYLQRQDINVASEMTSDVDSIKDEYGVPHELRSCHSMVIGGYVVEGHMPAEAIEKLLREKPDLAGIALPGMPSGSPGMMGPKGTYEIFGFTKDGESSLYMTL